MTMVAAQRRPRVSEADVAVYGSREETQLSRRKCTYARIRQLSRAIASHYDAELVKVGLKTSQFALLSEVRSMGPVRPTDLANRTGLDPSTLTRNLKPLVAAGWVEVAAGGDGRSRSVSLTRSGRAKLQAGEHNWLEAQERLNQLVGEDRLAPLHDALDQFLAVLHPGR